MDNDTDDESNSTGGTSVFRVAGLATLQQVPARVVLGRLGRESQNNPVKINLMRAPRSIYATLQEPFADLSLPFPAFSPVVFLHHAYLCLTISFWTIPQCLRPRTFDPATVAQGGACVPSFRSLRHAATRPDRITHSWTPLRPPPKRKKHHFWVLPEPRHKSMITGQK